MARWGCDIFTHTSHNKEFEKKKKQFLLESEFLIKTIKV